MRFFNVAAATIIATTKPATKIAAPRAIVIAASGKRR
jgi:hypothetical protein